MGVLRAERKEDMSPDGKLIVIQQEDGDMILAIAPSEEQDDSWMKSVEFCSIGGGGGRSRNTRIALKNLMEAMEKDNQEEPLS